MKKFESGVKWYTTGQAVVDIYFPEDDICCKWCPFCRSESDLGRFWCRLKIYAAGYAKAMKNASGINA